MHPYVYIRVHPCAWQASPSPRFDPPCTFPGVHWPVRHPRLPRRLMLLTPCLHAGMPPVNPQMLLAQQRAAEIAAKISGVPVAVPLAAAGMAGMPSLSALGAATAAGRQGLGGLPLASGLGGGVGGPRPLRLDALGRELDEQGNVVMAAKVGWCMHVRVCFLPT